MTKGPRFVKIKCFQCGYENLVNIKRFHLRKDCCPECGYEPTIFDGTDYHRPACGWWGEIILPSIECEKCRELIAQFE